MPSKSEAHRSTLTYALAIAGDKRELATQLRVTVAQLERWLANADDVPDQVFFDAIDLVTGSSREAIWRSRELLANASRL